MTDQVIENIPIVRNCRPIRRAFLDAISLNQGSLELKRIAAFESDKIIVQPVQHKALRIGAGLCMQQQSSLQYRRNQGCFQFSEPRRTRPKTKQNLLAEFGATRESSQFEIAF